MALCLILLFLILSFLKYHISLKKWASLEGLNKNHHRQRLDSSYSPLDSINLDNSPSIATKKNVGNAIEFKRKG